MSRPAVARQVAPPAPTEAPPATVPANPFITAPSNPFLAAPGRGNPFLEPVHPHNAQAFSVPPVKRFEPVRVSPYAVGNRAALTPPVSSEAVLIRSRAVPAIPVVCLSGMDVSNANCLCGGAEGHDPALWRPGHLIDFDEIAQRLGEDDHAEGYCPYEPDKDYGYENHYRRERDDPRSCGCPHPLTFREAPIKSAWQAAQNEWNPWLDDIEPITRRTWRDLRPMLRARRDQVRAKPELFLANRGAGHLMIHQIFELLGIDKDEEACHTSRMRGTSSEVLLGQALQMIDRGERSLELLDMIAEYVVHNDLEVAWDYVLQQSDEDFRSWRTPQPGSTDYERGLRDALSDKEMVHSVGEELPLLGGRTVQALSCGPTGFFAGGDGDAPTGVWEVSDTKHHHMLDEDDDDVPPFLLSWRRVHVRPHGDPEKLKAWREATKWIRLTPGERNEARHELWAMAWHGRGHSDPRGHVLGAEAYERKARRLELMRDLYAHPEEIEVFTEGGNNVFHFERFCGDEDFWGSTGDDRDALYLHAIFEMADGSDGSAPVPWIPCSECFPPPPDAQPVQVRSALLPKRYPVLALREVLKRLGGTVIHTDGSGRWHAHPDCWVLAHEADSDPELFCGHSVEGVAARTGVSHGFNVEGNWLPCLECLPVEHRDWLFAACAEVERSEPTRVKKPKPGVKPAKGKKGKKGGKAPAAAVDEPPLPGRFPHWDQYVPLAWEADGDVTPEHVCTYWDSEHPDWPTSHDRDEPYPWNGGRKWDDCSSAFSLKRYDELLAHGRKGDLACRELLDAGAECGWTYASEAEAVRVGQLLGWVVVRRARADAQIEWHLVHPPKDEDNPGEDFVGHVHQLDVLRGWWDYAEDTLFDEVAEDSGEVVWSPCPHLLPVGARRRDVPYDVEPGVPGGLWREVKVGEVAGTGEWCWEYHRSDCEQAWGKHITEAGTVADLAYITRGAEPCPVCRPDPLPVIDRPTRRERTMDDYAADELGGVLDRIVKVALTGDEAGNEVYHRPDCAKVEAGLDDYLEDADYAIHHTNATPCPDCDPDALLDVQAAIMKLRN